MADPLSRKWWPLLQKHTTQASPCLCVADVATANLSASWSSTKEHSLSLLSPLLCPLPPLLPQLTPSRQKPDCRQRETHTKNSSSSAGQKGQKNSRVSVAESGGRRETRGIADEANGTERGEPPSGGTFPSSRSPLELPRSRVAPSSLVKRELVVVSRFFEALIAEQNEGGEKGKRGDGRGP